MKPSLFLLLIILLSSCAVQKSEKPANLYFNENKEAISEEEFNLKWHDPKNPYSRWDSIHNGTRYISLSSPDYDQYKITFLPFLENIENLTGKKIPDNTILLLRFVYKDDLCSSTSSNSWTAGKIRERKRSHGPDIKKVEEENENLIFLAFFEEGIELANRPESKKEYFFQDREGFLRNSIFRNHTLCGSYALVKPNGQVLVQNGEANASYMAAHLKSVYWNIFFPEEE